MYQLLYEESLKRAEHKVWILSDLQQGEPENTKKCLETGINDFEMLGRPAEQIWYLGDAVEGNDEDRLYKMCDLQERAFADLKIPLCYATGNHDYDTTRNSIGKTPFLPFYEMVRDHPGWHTTKNCDEFYFRVTLGKYPVYFMCDHVAQDTSWLVTHSTIRFGNELYPYTDEDAAALRNMIAAEQSPVITCAHYGFSGCNRDHALMDHILPLPENVRIHFYGHSHIGDWRWGQENTYRRISWIDWHDIPQIDVSSFENIRGRHCRSVLLHIYENGNMGIFFRDHDDHKFVEAYFPAGTNDVQGWNKYRGLWK